MLKGFTRVLAHIITVALLLGMLVAIPQVAGAVQIVSGVPSGLTVGGKVYFGTYPQSAYAPTSSPPSPTMGTVYTDTNGTEFCYSDDADSYYKMEPIEWRVLANGSGEMFLLSEKNLDAGKAYHNSFAAVTWETSAMRAFLNNRTTPTNNPYIYSFIDLAFNTAEQAAIPEAMVQNPDNPDHSTSGGNATQDQIFLLSIQEVTDTALGFSANTSASSDRIAVNTAYTASFPNAFAVGNADARWLRSPGRSAFYAANVSETGEVYALGNAVLSPFYVIRPAFKLNLSSVLFTSAAAGGKSTATVGSGLVGASAPTGAVKLTVLDSSLSLSSSATVGMVKAGDTVSIPYTGAAIGANRYVSCVIEDSVGTVLFYGKLVDCTGGSANGMASFTVPAAADLPVGSYIIKLFNEECNADNYTDLASAPVSISMTVNNALPTVVSVSPSGTNAPISGNVVITFSTPMNPAIIGTVQLNPVLTGGAWSAGNTVFTIPYSGLNGSTTYAVNISGFADAAGNMMLPNSSQSFTTAGRPASTLPQTGDGFPMGALLMLMGALLAGTGWMGLRMRGRRTKA